MLGAIRVESTSNRGFTPEELAERALAKLIMVSDSADPMVKAQAMVFQDKIRAVLIFYMYEAINSYKTTQWAHLNLQGHSDMANIIHKI